MPGNRSTLTEDKPFYYTILFLQAEGMKEEVMVMPVPLRDELKLLAGCLAGWLNGC